MLIRTAGASSSEPFVPVCLSTFVLYLLNSGSFLLYWNMFFEEAIYVFIVHIVFRIIIYLKEKKSDRQSDRAIKALQPAGSHKTNSKSYYRRLHV